MRLPLLARLDFWTARLMARASPALLAWAMRPMTSAADREALRAGEGHFLAASHYAEILTELKEAAARSGRG